MLEIFQILIVLELQQDMTQGILYLGLKYLLQKVHVSPVVSLKSQNLAVFNGELMCLIERVELTRT